MRKREVAVWVSRGLGSQLSDFVAVSRAEPELVTPPGYDGRYETASVIAWLTMRAANALGLAVVEPGEKRCVRITVEDVPAPVEPQGEET